MILSTPIGVNSSITKMQEGTPTETTPLTSRREHSPNLLLDNFLHPQALYATRQQLQRGARHALHDHCCHDKALKNGDPLHQEHYLAMASSQIRNSEDSQLM